MMFCEDLFLFFGSVLMCLSIICFVCSISLFIKYIRKYGRLIYYKIKYRFMKPIQILVEEQFIDPNFDFENEIIDRANDNCIEYLRKKYKLKPK